jgi:CTP synthase
VKELRSIGIQPDILVCRSDQELPPEERSKIALFTNVPERAVISAINVDTIYRIPKLFHDQWLDDIVVDKFRVELPPADLREWDTVVRGLGHPDRTVSVAMVGKYVELTDAYKSLNESLFHAGIQTRTRVNIVYVRPEEIESNGTACLEGMDAILVPGGFGERGIEGKIATVCYARESGTPYLGICLGMQVAVIEFARNVANLVGANSTEFDRECEHPVIALITEWQENDGTVEHRTEASDLGGTMRLGGQICRLDGDNIARRTYNRGEMVERHRHRYEFNNRYLERLQSAGLLISGRSIDGTLVEIVEIPDHPWFLGCQFHPEFTSTPRDGHPLFTGFILAAREAHAEQPDRGVAYQ